MDFSLTNEQLAKFNTWAIEIKAHKYNPGAIGGNFTFHFTPTTIGTLVRVTHSSGAELDLTDHM